MVWTKKGCKEEEFTVLHFQHGFVNTFPPKKMGFHLFSRLKNQVLKTWPFRKFVFVWIAVQFGRKIYRIWSCLFGGGGCFFEYNSLSYHITKCGEYHCYFDLTGFIKLPILGGESNYLQIVWHLMHFLLLVHSLGW